jgi:ABC-2 type transport system ATP-binding protein
VGFEVDNLCIRYGTHTALDGVSLAFESGALGLLGPNGAGKSSLLRALLGFVRPASGRVRVLDTDPGADSVALRRRIGYSPEDDVLLPGMNGVSAVALCGELCGLPRADALQRAHEMLFFVGLGEVRYRRADTYSQGMRQRLKLAEALVHDPELLILDEPTNGLDPRGRQEMLALVADLTRAKGIHLVLSSHLLPDVEAVCDQVAVLDAGRLVRSGRMTDLLASPTRAFELRVKGPQENFAAHLRALGATCRPQHHGLLYVETRDGGAEAVFQAAAATGCQVRQLLPARNTLEDVFTAAVHEGPTPGSERAHP